MLRKASASLTGPRWSFFLWRGGNKIKVKPNNNNKKLKGKRKGLFMRCVLRAPRASCTERWRVELSVSGRALGRRVADFVV